MITVADILALPAFEQVQAITRCAGAGAREGRNVGILDCAPDQDNGYLAYIPGEFIVTNLGSRATTRSCPSARFWCSSRAACRASR